jgi:hypothetical protein
MKLSIAKFNILCAMFGIIRYSFKANYNQKYRQVFIEYVNLK